MAKIESINTDRILWCCRDAGIGPAELAASVQMEPEKLQAVLDGQLKLTVTQLRKIAKFFHRGLLFFLEEGNVKERALRTNGFRTLANEQPKMDAKIKSIVEMVERQRNVFLALQEDLEHDKPTIFQPPVIPQNIPAAAAILRGWVDISEKCTFETYRSALEDKGIFVVRSNGYNGAWQVPLESEVIGFSIYHKVYPIIFVRKQQSTERQLFTLIHEFAHIVLHNGGIIDENRDLSSHKNRERDANSFAGHFLVPELLLKDIDLKNQPSDASDFDRWLRPFTSRWGVSGEVVLRRLLDSNLISDGEYSNYRKWKATIIYEKSGSGSRKYRHREPKHLFGDNYVRTVLDALGSRKITLTRASSYLDNLKIADIHRLERFYESA